MSLSVGIVGMPNVGKSTLFNALTGAEALAANYPFATVEPNVGIVPIPDPRLEGLAQLVGSARVVPATVRFVDIAGLVRGASEGEGLGNQFLGHIRDVDGLCEVVRVFSSDQVAHVEPDIDPQRDVGTIRAELALADLETLDRRLERLERQASADRSLEGLVSALLQLRSVIVTGSPLHSDPAMKAIHDYVPDMRLLTAKPVVYVFNCDQSQLGDGGLLRELEATVSPAQALFVDLDLEVELSRLTPSDRAELLAAAGMEQPGIDRVIRSVLDSLGLQTFLTGNASEARAWTIGAGGTAHEAAGVVHSDFQRGFIAAEVIDFDELVEAGSWQRARAAGLVRTEGRSYVMRPNDVVEFRFNL